MRRERDVSAEEKKQYKKDSVFDKLLAIFPSRV